MPQLWQFSVLRVYGLPRKLAKKLNICIFFYS